VGTCWYKNSNENKMNRIVIIFRSLNFCEDIENSCAAFYDYEWATVTSERKLVHVYFGFIYSQIALGQALGTAKPILQSNA
jgi:hypothetical protein